MGLDGSGCLPNVSRRKLAEPPGTDKLQERLKNVLVLLDGLSRAAFEPFPQPVLCCLAYGVGGVASFRGDPLVHVGVQGLQLVLDRGLGLAGDLPPDAALAVRGISEGHGPAPDAGAAVVPFGIVASTASVLEVDRVLAPPAPPGHDMSVPKGGAK